MLGLKHWIDSQDRSLQCGSTVFRTPLRYGLGLNRPIYRHRSAIDNPVTLGVPLAHFNQLSSDSAH